MYTVGSLRIVNRDLKALVNEDTLLRTHCFPWCFLSRANWGTFVADAKCFWTKSETFLCPGHKICVRNKCCARGQTGKHLCRQQCVRNNVSSFARAFTQNTTATATRTPQNKWFIMRRTIAVHVRYNSWYISLPSSAKQQREMTKFCVVWRTLPQPLIFLISIWNWTHS